MGKMWESGAKTSLKTQNKITASLFCAGTKATNCGFEVGLVLDPLFEEQQLGAAGEQD